MRRRRYLRMLGGLPVVTAGVSGCLSGSVSGPADRALTAEEIGETWTYSEGGSPVVTESGTITASYRTDEPYPQTVRVRLWPCEGETLEALGGTCSLGNLPDQMRANESVSTANRSIGETAFLWWTDLVTDIEVVAANHVFRLTHTPLSETDSDADQEMPFRDDRFETVTRIAQLQTDKIERMTRTLQGTPCSNPSPSCRLLSTQAYRSPSRDRVKIYRQKDYRSFDGLTPEK